MARLLSLVISIQKKRPLLPAWPRKCDLIITKTTLRRKKLDSLKKVIVKLGNFDIRAKSGPICAFLQPLRNHTLPKCVGFIGFRPSADAKALVPVDALSDTSLIH